VARAAIAVTIACLLTGCVPRPEPAPAFVAYLEGYGQAFTASDPPPGVVGTLEVRKALEAHPLFPRRATVLDPPIYGLVTCIGPAECLDNGFATIPGETIAIWLVSYPDPPGQRGGGWAVVDATSGEYLMGVGGQGP